MHMTRAWERGIMRRHPRLYRLARMGPAASSMCFGFECGRGWARILARTTLWFKALWCLLRFDARATQVKEKMGGLRFCWLGAQAPRWMRGCPAWLAWRASLWAEDRAEWASHRTCEVCGAPGRHGRIGWRWMTRCPHHWQHEVGKRGGRMPDFAMCATDWCPARGSCARFRSATSAADRRGAGRTQVWFAGEPGANGRCEEYAPAKPAGKDGGA